MTKDLPRSESLLSTTSSIHAAFETGRRQRKVDMSAAAAAAMVAAAKASKRSAALKLSSDPASLGRDLVRRVDSRTIQGIIDGVLLRRVDDSPVDEPSPLLGDFKADAADAAVAENEESPHYLFTPQIQRHTHDHRPTRSLPTTPSPVDSAVPLTPLKGKGVQEHSHQNSTLSERHALRREAAVHELLTTEDSYCRDLDILVNHFFRGIADAQCLTDATRERLVRNAPDILQFQTKFMEALRQASMTARESLIDERVISIAKCFCEWGQKFEVYIDYCMYHDKACSLHKELMDTTPAFVSTLEKLHMSRRQTDGNGRRKFDDYLIMPVQRLFKYKLMLESILKTTQSDSKEHSELLQALKMMHKVAIHLNTRKSTMEAARKTKLFMNRIESDWVNAVSKRFYGLLGSCILIGTLDVRALHEGPKIKRLGCALFKSYMIVVKAKKHDRYEPRHWFPLRMFNLEEMPDEQPSSYHSWSLRNEKYTIEFAAMCDQEKQVWLDALRTAIRSNKEKLPASDGQTPGNAVEELFVSSLDNVMPSTIGNLQHPHACVSTTSLNSYVSRTDPSASALDKPDTPVSTESPNDDSPTHPSAAQGGMLNSPGMRSHASFGDFYGFVTNTVADIRSQRRHQQYNVRCTNVDSKFEDVCTTPILTARSQARHDRYSGVDPWKRKSRMGKSASMLAFTSVSEDERVQQQQQQQQQYLHGGHGGSTMSSPRETTKGGMSEAFMSAVRRKASLPSRLRLSESMILDEPQQCYRRPLASQMMAGSAPPMAPTSAGPPTRTSSSNSRSNDYTGGSYRKPSTSQPTPVSTESMIFKLSRRGSTQTTADNHARNNTHAKRSAATDTSSRADLPPTPGLQRSISAATMVFARSSSKFFGRVVDKLGTIGTPRRARRCNASEAQLSDKASSATVASYASIHSADVTQQKKPKPRRSFKRPPPLLIPGSPVTQAEPQRRFAQ